MLTSEDIAGEDSVSDGVESVSDGEESVSDGESSGSDDGDIVVPVEDDVVIPDEIIPDPVITKSRVRPEAGVCPDGLFF